MGVGGQLSGHLFSSSAFPGVCCFDKFIIIIFLTNFQDSSIVHFYFVKRIADFGFVFLKSCSLGLVDGSQQCLDHLPG